MFKNQKVVVVMPAYNAARTLEMTHREVLAQGVVDLDVCFINSSPVELPYACTVEGDRRHVQNVGAGG